MKLPLHYQCVLDEDGGILLASKCLATFQVNNTSCIITYMYVCTLCINDTFACLLYAYVFCFFFQNLFVKSGGILKDYHKVTEIIPGERVTAKTRHGDFMARKVIITAGPWTPKIMRQLGVELPVVVSE